MAIFLVALNMRMSVTGIGPLLDDIAESRGVSAATLGLLASIPLIVWAIVCPITHDIAARLGIDRTITLALVVLAAGTVWRSLSLSPADLWVGTVLIGAALAVANVLMPAIVKRDFESRTAGVMGVYSGLIGASAAIGTAIALPVARFRPGAAGGSSPALGWEAGLLAGGAIIPLALVVWVLVARASKRAASASEPRSTTASSTAPSTPAAPSTATRHGTRVWRDRTAWLLAIYMGAQSATFYICATWIVPVLLTQSVPEMVAGAWVTVFHFGGMGGSLLAPVILRFDGRSLLQVLLPATGAVGFLGLVFAPSFGLLWMIVLGLGCGAGLSVTLTLIALRSRDTATASAVSGMSQAFGYLVAALGPVLFGLAHDLTGAWVLSLAVVLAAVSAQFVTGLMLRDGRLVRL